MPRRNRRLPRLVERLHRRPDFIDAPREEIADQQVCDGAAKLGIASDELAKAEARIVLADQPPHPIDALIELRAPPAELGGRGITPREAVDNRLGSHRPRT